MATSAPPPNRAYHGYAGWRSAEGASQMSGAKRNPFAAAARAYSPVPGSEQESTRDSHDGFAVDQQNPAYRDTQANPAFAAPTADPRLNASGAQAARRLELSGASMSMGKVGRSRLSQAAVPSTSFQSEIQTMTPGEATKSGEATKFGDLADHGTEVEDYYEDYPDGDENEDHDTDNYDEDDEEAPLRPKQKRLPPIVHRWNIIPCILFVWFLGASGYYYYIRWFMLTNSYAIFVYAVEILGWTSFTPYALLIMRGVYPTGSPGLPPAGSPEADEQAAWWASPSRNTPGRPRLAKEGGSNRATPMSNFRGTPNYTAGALSPAISIPETSYFTYRFHVRVLVPCYKEDLAVIASTVQAALSADLPALTRRTVYLLDDGKDPEKKNFIESLRLSGEDIVYISGRIRRKGEVNGKSGNLNNALKNVIYKNYPRNDEGEIDWTEISNKECVVVFDADMNCKTDFFLKELEVMVDDNIALVLSPQAFYNIDTDMDIFNAINAQFWEYWLPGAFGWGYIACTGTNFMIRARALCHCGFFPDYTITEDYALGMELKSHGYKATYLCQYIAVGEAPEEARNIFQQRSRWTKGHYQVFFSGINALLNLDLPFFQRLWYTYAAWAPFCTAVTVPAFMLVPFMSLVFGYNPVTITFEFVLAATLYFVCIQCVQNYCTSWSHVKLMWYVNVSNTVLWFTYVKAFFNTLALKAGMKIATFKATAKTRVVDPNAPPLIPPVPAPMTGAPEPVTQPPPPPAPTTMVGRILSNLSQRFTPRKDQAVVDIDFNAKATDEDEYPYPVRVGKETPVKRALHYSDPSRPPAGKDGSQFTVPSAVKPNDASVASVAPIPEQAPEPAPPAPVAEKELNGWARVKAIAATFKPQNVSEFGRMMDPLALLFLWIFNMGTVGVGVWQLSMVATKNTTTAFQFNSPLKGNPYLIISTVWALYNSLSPYMFLHYCVTAGTSFKFVVKWIMHFSNFVMFGSIIIVWLLIPAEFQMQDVVTLAAENYLPNSIPTDNNTNYLFVVGKEAIPVASDILDSMVNHNRQLLATSLPMINLTGGLLMSDHVKYSMPIAYTVSMLAWTYIQFPQGITTASKPGLLKTIRAGADYLMRCFIKLPDGTAVYVAQVGDGADYALLQDPGYDPVGSGKIWTSPSQDAQLSGKEQRKVWLMTADSIGADLLADVTAALAATSMAFKKEDPAFALTALKTAEMMYQFATKQSDAPHSYCEYVPCSTKVKYTKQVMAKPFVAPPAQEPVCFYLDWVDKACYIAMDINTCTELAKNQKEVFKTRAACCNEVTNLKLWDLLTSKAQGICAVPEDSWKCYVPDNSLRTCFEYPINNQTGKGCVGQGLEVYPTGQTCCNYLLDSGAIDASANRPGVGLCARIHRDPNFKTCYVPVLNNATCDVKTGTDCDAYGISSAFDDVAGCCNNMIEQMQALGFNHAGGVQITTSGMCSLYFDQHDGPTRRSDLEEVPQPQEASRPPSLVGSVVGAFKGVLDFGSDIARSLLGHGRRLGDTTPAPAASGGISITIGSASAPPTVTSTDTVIKIDNSSYWINPPTIAKHQCADNACSFIVVEDIADVYFFNSTSIMDDLAWAAVWMYRATNNALYMGQAQKFLERHYKEDITIATMIRDRSYYRSNWNNLAWNVNVLMASITGKQEYINKVELFLKTWVFGNSVNLDTPLPPATAVVDIANITGLTNFTDPDTKKTWIIVQECTPTAKYEINCFDDIDNNCNGLTDREDPDCGLFPVLYTHNQLAYSGAPGGPNSANAAMTALMYAETAKPDSGRRLRCWALNQMAYMIGVMPDQPSLVVGYGNNPPTSVQHRASSCPLNYSPVTRSNPNAAQAKVSLLTPNQTAMMSTTQQSLVQTIKSNEPVCNWDNAYYPSTPNPQLNLIKGALIYGPDDYYPFVKADYFSRERTSASTMATLHDTVGFMSSAMALTHTGTTIRSCELLHGVYQKYMLDGVL